MTAKNKPTADEPILLRDDLNGVATLTLNRPAKYNALSTELMERIQLELDRFVDDRTVRAVIIAGNGDAFCAGHDLREMNDDPSPEAIQALFDQCSRMMVSLTKIPQPVIARVHGIATAAGCQLVAQCDLAVASDTARFATSGINVGLFCGTPMVAVTRNLPRKQAMEMLMTGAFIDAAAAERYGLVNRVVPAAGLDAAVREMAESVAHKGPAFVAAGKKLFYRQIEDGLAAAYDEASQIMVENMQREDARDGIASFLEKREMPEWKDR